MGDEEVLSGASTPSEAQEAIEQPSSAPVEHHVPRVNCPEHIIIILDVCKEDTTTPFRLADGSKFSALSMVKRALTLFLQNKHAIDSSHKFALIILEDVPVWAVDFTSNPRDIISALENIPDVPPSTYCDLSRVFDLIARQISLPKCVDPKLTPPPFVYRTVLVYGRSQCLPQFLGGKELFTHLIQSPHFTLDILYTHEPPSDDNKCEGIFDLLCGLDEIGLSYILEVSRNATKLHNHFGSLLAHPLQRPDQRSLHYNLNGEK